MSAVYLLIAAAIALGLYGTGLLIQAWWYRDNPTWKHDRHPYDPRKKRQKWR